MKRILGIAAAILIAFILVTPVALAAAFDQTGRVLVSVRGDVTLPAGEQADVVVVVEGVATIEGQVNTVVAINGSAILTAAQVETVVAVQWPISVEPEISKRPPSPHAAAPFGHSSRVNATTTKPTPASARASPARRETCQRSRDAKSIAPAAATIARIASPGCSAPCAASTLT